VIATSGRMLAKKLKQAGYRPLVIDLFADQDTSQIADDIRMVHSLAVEDIASAIEELRQLYPVKDVVYGSGFEKQLPSLFFLQKKINLLGNTPEIFKKIQDKEALFETLRKYQIRFPGVSFSRPGSGAWLFKPIQSEGGHGVSFNKHDNVSFQQGYWQQFQPGEGMSATFVADGKCAEIIGFNQQWSINLGSGQEFLFSGVCNQPGISAKNKKIISEWMATLVAHFELKGLNGIDFLVHKDQCYFLEINPRPTASVELYPADLVFMHAENSVKKILTQKLCYGYQVIYAKADCSVPDMIDWPVWVQDRPKCNTIVGKHQPLCSIFASAPKSSQTLSVLASRQKIVENLFQQET